MEEILQMSALELSKQIRHGSVSVKEAVEACKKQIQKSESQVHAYVSMDEKILAHRIKEVEEGIKSGRYTGPLAGVPIAVKDNICTRGQKTTCSSKMLENFVPTYDAQAVKQLEDAGMVILGKTNMDEFAMGSTTETSAFGVTRNPWNPEHVPGGSSGGSCAAVAAGEAVMALGSDTGGSIRQPAAYCGVTGLKPTYGRVSRYGLIAYASSLVQIGPIGIPKEYLAEGCDEEVKKALADAVHTLSKNGAVVEFFSLGMVDYVIPAYYIIACAEASSNLERFDGVKYGYRTPGATELHEMYKKSRAEGFGEEVKRRILLGSFVLSAGYYDAYYMKALRAKGLIKKEFDKAFQKYDCILAPASPTTAPKIGTSLSDPLQMYLSDIYTVAVNLAGLPAVSLPCGMDSRGLPIGMQLIGDCFQEKKILRAAAAYEQLRGEFPKAWAKEEK